MSITENQGSAGIKRAAEILGKAAEVSFRVAQAALTDGGADHV